MHFSSSFNKEGFLDICSNSFSLTTLPNLFLCLNYYYIQPNKTCHSFSKTLIFVFPLSFFFSNYAEHLSSSLWFSTWSKLTPLVVSSYITVLHKSQEKPNHIFGTVLFRIPASYLQLPIWHICLGIYYTAQTKLKQSPVLSLQTYTIFNLLHSIPPMAHNIFEGILDSYFFLHSTFCSSANSAGQISRTHTF